ncbi:serine/threonine-protein kinase/endoribonuclease ire-1 [Daphnia magna]|uniref:serine/threonine-protein kinase/endoribonuclease ire-1 n=1 Tax=Daphnia magna TaxID=35525 RepID=UPI001E1BAF74|nr:serine/threonine-protein kinase/endoribonuclease ire-1 [Daphnia magna]
MAENVRRTLEEGAPLIEQPRETTSIDTEIREPVREGHDCKLFRICTGKENDPYLYVPHFQKEKKKRPIYEGYYNCDVPVAIVRIDPSSHSGPTKKEIGRELQILKELEVHENFIRYFTHEMNKDFVFIATELCLCSVADLLDPALEEEIPEKEAIMLDLQAKEILRQATRGLSYLHQNNFVHRNIKPNNFLIKEVKTGDKSCRFVVKITDFRLTRKRDPHKNLQLSGSVASEGWEAPESQDLEKDLSTKLDVFILGCFYHYVFVALSKNEANNGKPRHPFGDSNMRTYNIINRDYFSKRELPFVSNDEEEAKVVDLIKKMLMFNEEDRPTLQQVLEDDYFEPSEDYKIYNYEDKSKKPGLCVIFNQEKFEDGKRSVEEVRGTEMKFGYALKTEINDLANERDFKDYGCLVVCLLSHGIEDAILCNDGKFVNTNELKYQFSLDNCPSLYGKPKVFIIQACQGKLGQSKTGIKAPLEKSNKRRFDSNIDRVGY